MRSYAELCGAMWSYWGPSEALPECASRVPSVLSWLLCSACALEGGAIGAACILSGLFVLVLRAAVESTEPRCHRPFAECALSQCAKSTLRDAIAMGAEWVL